MYSNKAMWQTKRHVGMEGKNHNQMKICMYQSEPLMDWHSQVFTIFEMLLQVQQFLSGMK